MMAVIDSVIIFGYFVNQILLVGVTKMPGDVDVQDSLTYLKVAQSEEGLLPKKECSRPLFSKT